LKKEFNVKYIGKSKRKVGKTIHHIISLLRNEDPNKIMNKKGLDSELWDFKSPNFYPSSGNFRFVTAGQQTIANCSVDMVGEIPFEDSNLYKKANCSLIIPYASCHGKNIFFYDILKLNNKNSDKFNFSLKKGYNKQIENYKNSKMKNGIGKFKNENIKNEAGRNIFNFKKEGIVAYTGDTLLNFFESELHEGMKYFHDLITYFSEIFYPEGLRGIKKK
jgi:hypothetical protein